MSYPNCEGPVRSKPSLHIAVPASGGSISAQFTREYRLRTGGRFQPGDALINISPPSEDGFYAEGTQVQVTANPAAGEDFAGWIGEVSGSEPAQSVLMDAAKWLEPVFTHREPLEPGETKTVALLASGRFRLHNAGDSQNVLVPPDAAELTFRFRTSSNENVDLFVRRGANV